MIFGKRIRLRAIEKSDLPLFVNWLNDPEVRRFLLTYLPLSMSTEEQWFADVLRRPQEEHPLVIDVNTDEGWTPIGEIGLERIERLAGKAEVGILIGDKRFWNQGYGTEAMRLMLRHGFNTLNLHRIYLRVDENNVRGIRAYEKAGFIVEGRLRDDHFRDGQYVHMLMMSVLRPEWKDQD